MNLENRLENIPIKDDSDTPFCLYDINEKTFQNSTQVLRSIREDNCLFEILKSNQSRFYTNNFAMYAYEDVKSYMYFGASCEPIFKDWQYIEQDCDYKYGYPNYILEKSQKEEILDLVSSGEVTKISMWDLRLSEDGAKFEIKTKNFNPQNYNAEELKLIGAIFGREDELIENMKMYERADKSEISVIVWRSLFLILEFTQIFCFPFTFLKNHLAYLHSGIEPDFMFTCIIYFKNLLI